MFFGLLVIKARNEGISRLKKKEPELVVLFFLLKELIGRFHKASSLVSWSIESRKSIGTLL